MPTSHKLFSYPNSSPKIYDDLFYSFLTIFTFNSKLLSGLPSLFSQNSLFGCPRLDARGRRTPWHFLCTPLVLSGVFCLEGFDRGGFVRPLFCQNAPITTEC